MNLNTLIHILLGPDGADKDAKIAELKGQHSSTESLLFDTEVLYADDLDLPSLKKSLLSLPAIAAQRFILIHAAHRLSAEEQSMILEFASSGQRHAVVVLESSEWKPDHEFVRKAGAKAKVTEFYKVPDKNVFDMTKLMAARQPAQALQVLAELFHQGIHPLQILGGIIWFWGRQRERLGCDKYEEGLRTLQEADLNVKRSRINADYAVEVAVVKLCGLL